MHRHRISDGDRERSSRDRVHVVGRTARRSRVHVVVPTTRRGRCVALVGLVSGLVLGLGAHPQAARSADAREAPLFLGLRALVVRPDNFWGWDSAVFGALEERGFEVTYGAADLLEDRAGLSRYDIVATNIKRSFTPPQVEALKGFVSSGGALYGTWGGPMGAASLLREVCKVGGTRSVRIMEMTLLGGTPLSAGIGERRLPFPQHMGHAQPSRGGWEIVSTQALPGGIPVAKDPQGNVLGVLSQYGQGRTAVLGFGPEKEKQFVDWELGPVMFDNLLRWLLHPESNEKLGSWGRVWSKEITVALPARAEVLTVELGGRDVGQHLKVPTLRGRRRRPPVRTVGSLRKIRLDVGGVRPGASATVRVSYKPLAKARNVEAMIHLPWNTMVPAASSPAALAEYLESIHTTVVQPLLRGGYGTAWYKGLPEDNHHEKLVKRYEGNFLSDLIAECHERGIKVIGGIYFSNAVVKRRPTSARLDRSGQPVKDQYKREQTCFNRPEGQEYNLATVRHLFEKYKLDGIILDDNFELDHNNCYCSHCKEGFRRYCTRHRITYSDPSGFSGGPIERHWKEYQREATRLLAGRVTKIARGYGRPAGGWVGASIGATHLGGSFDFLGGMVYTEPPRAARLPLSVLGECEFVCLLWAPDMPPELMMTEAREAVHSGCAIVGYWIRGNDGGYRMHERRTLAMGRAFESLEAEWLSYYRANIVTGDARFAVTVGKVGEREMLVRIKNTGKRVDRRIQGALDLAALE